MGVKTARCPACLQRVVVYKVVRDGCVYMEYANHFIGDGTDYILGLVLCPTSSHSVKEVSREAV